jgi:hypothetical protein
MVAYRLAHALRKVESGVLKPKQSMGLKREQRVPSVPWVCGAYVKLKNLDVA